MQNKCVIPIIREQIRVDIILLRGIENNPGGFVLQFDVRVFHLVAIIYTLKNIQCLFLRGCDGVHRAPKHIIAIIRVESIAFRRTVLSVFMKCQPMSDKRRGPQDWTIPDARLQTRLAQIRTVSEIKIVFLQRVLNRLQTGVSEH